MALVSELRRETAAKQSHAIRNGLICALIVAACVWATYPVAQIGIDDEWSYIKTAQLFAQTGHFVYNGWAAMILGWQVVWAALFIKLFGFSFTVVRLSMLPIAMATIALFHASLLRFGINARNAMLGALTLGLSPLFIPMAASYMSDVPGLFVVVLCLYLCQRAVAAGGRRATLAWLCLAAASNVVGGTARQIAWLGALVMVPSTGWLLRKQRGVLPASLLLWVFSVASIYACMQWFARQPYSVPESLLHGYNYFHGNLGSNVFHFLFQMIGAALCLLLLVYPILAAWLPEGRRLDRAALLRIASVLAVWGVFQWITGWTMPWLSKVIRAEFATSRMDPTLPPAPFFLPMWMQALISLLVIATALVLLERRGLWSRIG
ncbi:MAG TPA: hypothetical protein VHA06_06100, partial [Candidatus Angelobacter sp.]|nr:hypothetical protein [Candidatus Angelobacter sp.]